MKAFSLKLIIAAAALLFFCIPANSQCFVDAGNDTTFCQQQGQLNATPMFSSPNYVYSWSPSLGLSNPNVQNPFVVSGVSNQTYIVTMLDTVGGCTNTDSVVVSAYYALIDTFYSCFPDSVLLDFGPGASGYAWQVFIDTNSANTTLTSTSQTLWATEPGQYLGFAMFTGCGALSGLATVIDSCSTSSSCAVDAGADHVNCQQPIQVQALALTPGNDYTYSWSPANLLVNPNSASAFGTYGGPGVHNQQFVVTMTDTVTGCIATDTVIVSSYMQVIDTFRICQNNVVLDFGPGATNYFWQFFTDTAGNTSPINASTQTITVNQPGNYLGYAVFPNCGAITSVFVVEDTCTVQSCTASIAQQTTYTSSCGDTMQFTGSFTGTIGNWDWRVNNQYVAYGNGGTPQFDWFIGTATYTITLTVYDVNFSCNATTSIVVNGTSGIVPTINLIQACGVAWNSQQFNPTITPASSNYTYSWTPATGLSDPNIRNPYVNGVYNESYTLTVTDTVTGCVGIDTVNGIYVSNYVNDTSYLCNNQPIVLATYPAFQFFSYAWSSGQNTSSITVTQPGVYSVVIMTGNCTFTSVYTVIDSCNMPVPHVWPGDCNYDLIVNMADALHIGLAYGATGATRPNASNLWYAQPMLDWNQSYVNCNYKHGDADGNGTIDVNDTVPIASNYSLTHPFRYAPAEISATAPTLQLSCTVDTVGLQTLVQVNVLLGTTAIPVDSLYGISFRITSDAGLIDTTLTVINASSSWLGNNGADMFTFRKQFQNAAVVDFAEVRNDHANRLNGNGPIASYFIVTTDNLSGIAICHFNLSEVTAVTASQTYIEVEIANDSVVIDPAAPSGINPIDQPVQFNMYPNPANDALTIQTGATATRIEICDMTGRVVEVIQPTSNVSRIQTSSFASGIYMVRVINGTTSSTQKLTISR